MPAVTSNYTIPALRIAHKSCITPLCAFCGMEDHEIYWKAPYLSSGSPAHCAAGVLHSAPDPLGRVSGQQLGDGEYRLRTQFRQDESPLFVAFPHYSGKRHLRSGR
ncbi:hypothetical protein L1887_45182 [Cichorium endivia]|nr:hypothetical protein L1887_45182 [Cichorium endivia]